MKFAKKILRKYYQDKLRINPEFELYRDIIYEAIFVINSKLNNGGEAHINGMSIDFFMPDATNGVFITFDDSIVKKDKEAQAMSMFFRQSTGLDSIRVSVNEEEKRSIIYTTTRYLSRDFWKALCGLLPMLVPWNLSFNGKNKEDVECVKSYLAKLFEGGMEAEGEARRIFSEVFSASGLKEEIIRSELEELSAAFLRTEQQRTRDAIEESKRRQRQLIREYEDVTLAIQNAKIKLMGLQANNGENNEIVKNIIFAVETTDNLNLMDIEGETLCFEYITPMEIWSSEEFEVFVENTRSYLYTEILESKNGCSSKPSNSVIKKFLQRIFETREYKVRFMTKFRLDFANARLTNLASEGPLEEWLLDAKVQNCIFNPHIAPDMTCMEEYAMQAAQCIGEGLYDDAIGAMCMAAKSFSISDLPIGRRFIKRIMDNKCIQTADGIMSGRDIICKLMAEETESTEV